MISGAAWPPGSEASLLTCDQETKVEELKRFVEVLEDEKKQLNIQLTQDIQVRRHSETALRLCSAPVRHPRHGRAGLENRAREGAAKVH